MRVLRAVNQSSQMKGLPKFLAKMALGLQDCTLFVETDSTGNETTEWVYLLAQWLAARYPTHTVVYKLWDNTSKTYATTNLQTGTGSRTLTIYNGAIPGAHCYYPQLIGFTTLFPVDPDVVLVAYGHNEGTHATEADGLTFAGRYRALIRRISLHFPSAEIALGIQNPQTTNTYQQLRSSFIRQTAQAYGLALYDAQSMFLANPNWATQWMGDAVHPNATGSRLGMLPPVVALFDDRLTGPATPILSSMAQQINLLTNGDFSAYPATPGAPTGWTVLGGATAYKDPTNFETAGQACKLVSGVGAAGWMQQNVDLTKYPISLFQGRVLSILVRSRRPNGNVSTSGRIQIYDGVSTGSTLQNATVQSDTGFYTEAISTKISPSATMVRVYLYADTSTAGSQEVTFDRVSLVRGDMPIDLYL